jgi:proteic killer suppression protein
MIKTFRNKQLESLWTNGQSRIDSKLHKRIPRRLDAVDAASEPDDLDLPGFNFHHLHGFDPTRYTVHVNGPWCITFEFDGGDAFRIDLEQYH